MPASLDDIDLRLIALLKRDALLPYRDLARELGMSPTGAHERVRRLWRSGVIRRATIQTDPKALDRGVCAFVQADVRGVATAELARRLARLPEVEEAHSVAGETCLMVKVRASSTEALEAFLHDFNATPGITRTSTTIVLRTYMEGGFLTDAPPEPAADPAEVDAAAAG